jgi:hypothetical protein
VGERNYRIVLQNDHFRHFFWTGGVMFLGSKSMKMLSISRAPLPFFGKNEHIKFAAICNLVTSQKFINFGMQNKYKFNA